MAAAAGVDRRSGSKPSTLQHISLERQVDLSGTLLSPDQARVSSEVAGVVREVRVQLGSEVRAGDVLVRLEPRELALALDRAESALRQVEAQLGIDRTQDEAAAAGRADRVGPAGDGQPRRRARGVRARRSSSTAAACCRRSTGTRPKPG